MPLDRLGTPNPSDLVEAAGVEPASENAASQEPTYVVAFPLPGKPGNFRLPRSECDKKRGPLAQDLISGLGPHPETSLLLDALPQPAGKAAEDGYLTN